MKSRWEEAVDERAMYILGTLRPHFERALGLHWQLAEERLRSLLPVEGLDSLAIGVVMLDKTGLVLLVNRAAERILAVKDGLMLSRQRIVAQSRTDTAALEALICATASEVRKLEQGGTVGIRRPSGLRPYIVTAVPAHPGTPAHRFGAGMLFIKDPEDAPLPDVDILMRVFGMTPAEARLCAGLAAGQTMQEFSEVAGVTGNTLKTHLRGAFAKTETSRQTDLVRLILTSLTAATPGGGR